MVAVRPFGSEDLDQVAALFEAVVRSGSRTPPASVRAWFRQALLESPWGDPDIPSLVASEGGKVVGFIASHVRRVRVDGRPVRLACSGQFTVDPEARRLAVGAQLLRAYLQGAQDLTITDGATDYVRRLWEGLGGETAWPQSLEWVYPLRPWRLAEAVVERRRGRPLPAVLQASGDALDVVTARGAEALRRRRGAPTAGNRAGPVTTEPLTPSLLVSELPRVADRLRLRPDYDAEYAPWLFRQLRAVEGRGDLRAALVRGSDGTPVGFYVYYLLVHGMSAVLSLASATEEGTACVLDAVVEDAREGGAAALHGRLEPRLAGLVAQRPCVVYPRTARLLVHSRDPALTALAASRQALLTRLEGDWWMRPHFMEPSSRARRLRRSRT